MIFRVRGGGDPERIISVPVCGQMGAIPGAPFFGIRPDGQMGVIFGSPFPRNPKSSRTATIQSKVLPDRKNSIQSPTRPQQFNPKSYRTAKKQSKVLPDRKNTKCWRTFCILFYTCHLKDEKYEIVAKVAHFFYIPATLRTKNTKCWRKFRNFFIYLPP